MFFLTIWRPNIFKTKQCNPPFQKRANKQRYHRTEQTNNEKNHRKNRKMPHKKYATLIFCPSRLNSLSRCIFLITNHLCCLRTGAKSEKQKNISLNSFNSVFLQLLVIWRNLTFSFSMYVLSSSNFCFSASITLINSSSRFIFPSFSLLQPEFSFPIFCC